MRRSINQLLLAGLIGTAVSGFMFAEQYGAAVLGRNDIWWTPPEQALALSAAASEIELHLDGKLLLRQIDLGALAVQDEKGVLRPVAPADIKIRLNNWHKIQAARLHGAVLAAIPLGISLTCLVFGIAQQVRTRQQHSA